MNLNSIQRRLQKNIENFGFKDTMYDLVFRAINRVTMFKILKGIKISFVSPGYLETNPRYCCQFLTKEMLREYAKNPDYEITETFLEEAFAKGDECFGIMDGDKLASYGWYSNKDTSIDNGLVLQFSPEYIYMYKGFTHEEYRGQRLHAIGMTLALREYLHRGFKGLVSYVESNNFSSLKSCYRMGYQDFGEVYILKVRKRHIIYSSPGCERYSFQVVEKSASLAVRDYQVTTEVAVAENKETSAYKARA
jgi:hypothetical protein